MMTVLFKLQSLGVLILILFSIFEILSLSYSGLIVSVIPKNAYAHFFGGKTLTMGKYQVLFAPYPATPTVSDNNNSAVTQLNFSVLENNSNIYNIYSALVISKKGSDAVIAQYPYKLYEFSDITIPFIFNETGDYAITLKTRIQGDPQYQTSPLEASFDVSVVSPLQATLSDRNVLIPLIAIPIVGACAIVVIYAWKKM